MPRPATIRMSVAMIGWMPAPATSSPFHRPRASGDEERQQDGGQHQAEAC